MKCIHCGNDTTYPVRSANGKRCGTCNHPFAFEPKTDPLTISDTLFQKCITDISAEGTLKFTQHQLYYEFAKRLVKKGVHIPAPFGWTATGLGACGLVAAFVGFPILAPVGVVGAIVTCVVGAKMGKKTPQARVPQQSFSQFQSHYMNPWIKTHGAIPGMLTPIPPVRLTGPRGVIYTDAPDLTAYSFDRALIVDKADVASMLVENRFHFENNCAILSLDRQFPANGRFEQVLEMLRRNPNLIVFTLHNASVDGLTVATKLRSVDWFPDPNIRIVDLGLRPKHIFKTHLLLEKHDKTTLPADARAGLDKDEIAWLEEGFSAELEALRPAKLMRAIYQGFSRSVTVGPDGGVVLVDSGPGIWVGGDSYGYNDGVYAADSFG